MQPSVLVLNGPNLNLLGEREPSLYGTTSLAEVEARCRTVGAEHRLHVDVRQSNHEGVLIDAVHEARETAAGIVINAGGYSHTSVALRDALAAAGIPVVEVHLTNIHRREAFRASSHVAAVADAVICGAGAHGYELALHHLARLIGKERA
ncbi:type II 3-dehydroquinate dehydratase [Spirillospora sp. NPDC047279]|uniref:type II 3-dehydroquinate dehydratase n=1 Tax=Spirillospora sp. NPDC047279 TaxID=3155478 RepID=UPI0033FD1F6D